MMCSDNENEHGLNDEIETTSVKPKSETRYPDIAEVMKPLLGQSQQDIDKLNAFRDMFRNSMLEQLRGIAQQNSTKGLAYLRETVLQQQKELRETITRVIEATQLPKGISLFTDTPAICARVNWKNILKRLFKTKVSIHLTKV